MFNRQAAVIVLAAGPSTRFRGEGQKLSQALGDDKVLGATLRHALATGLRVVAVCSQATVEDARSFLNGDDIVLVDGLGARTAPERGGSGGIRTRTLNGSQGIGRSIALGVGAAGDASAWLIVPGDMPLIRTDSMNAVLNSLSHHPIAFAQHQGMPGYPVGFDAELYSELIHLQCDEGPRRLMARYPSQGIELSDPGVLADINTPEDLQRLQAMQAH